MSVSDQHIVEMLREIVEELDYDLYKEMFVYEDGPNLGSLIGIVRKYLEE